MLKNLPFASCEGRPIPEVEFDLAIERAIAGASGPPLGAPVYVSRSAAGQREGIEPVFVAVVGHAAGPGIVAAAPIDDAVCDRRARPNGSAASEGPLDLTSPGVHGVEIAARGAGVNHAVGAGDKAICDVLGTLWGSGLPENLAGGGVECRP